MNGWMDRLERRLGGLAIPRLALWIVAVQTLLYLAVAAGRVEPDAIALVPRLVRAGEAYRLLTFVFFPPLGHPIFVFFALYLFFLMGTALESAWGAFRFNLFLLTGYLATVGAAFLFGPNEPATNLYLGGSVFLAFAILNPDFELRLFFLIPVRIKWLAVFTAATYAVALALGPGHTRGLVLASSLHLLIFFGPEWARRARAFRRRETFRRDAARREDEPFHQCAVCGRTDRSDPDREFVYLSTSNGTKCVCREHRTALGEP